MVMDISVRDLHYFIAVAEEGSLAKASKRCHITQPALSKSIARIEAALAQKLFIRDKRGMRLDSTGITFLRYAQNVCAEYDKTMRYAEQLKHGSAGLLHIGATRPLYDAILSLAIIEITAKTPKIRINLELRAAKDLVVLLEQDKLDMIIIPLSTHQAHTLYSQRLGADNVAVIAALGHKAFENDHHRLKDLVHYDWILPKKNSSARQWFIECFNRAKLPVPEPAVEVNYAGQPTLDIVSNTNHLLYVPGSWNTRLPTGLGHLHVPELDTQRCIYLITRRDTNWTPGMSQMRTILQEIFRERTS